MQRLFISCIITLSYISGFCQYSYTFTGTIKTNEFNNRKIYLTVQDNYSSNRYKTEDSCTVIDNSFTFKGSIRKPIEKAKLSFPKSSNFLNFSLDSGITNITFNTLPGNSLTYKNKLSNSHIENSQSNILCRKTDSLIVKYYASFAKPAKANSGVLQLSKEKIAELKQKQLDIIQQYSRNYYALIHLYNMLPEMLNNIPALEATFTQLDTVLLSSPLGIELKDKIELIKTGLIGQPVPEFNLATASNSIISSKEMSGKPYMLVFGATWCLPCKENYPMLLSLYKKYKNKGLEVIDINLDEDSIKWKSDIDKYSLDWINASELKTWDESEIVKKFSVRAIPLYMIVDKSGKIFYHSFQLLDNKHIRLEDYIKKAVD